jgi:hypothetical protein
MLQLVRLIVQRGELLDRHPLMLPNPARLAIQVFSQALEIFATQADPNLLVGGVEAQKDVFINQTEANFRRAQRCGSSAFYRLIVGFGACHFANVPGFT